MTQKATGASPIEILGACQHNLDNIDVTIPGETLTVITGVSGSGKSTLAFDTLYAEGQRRYVESLSAYARQFLERLGKPRVRDIRGIRPAIAIRQKNTTRNPRSTVGTVTEIYDFLRLLYARVGTIVCRSCAREVKQDTIDEVVSQVMALPDGTRLYLGFPFRDSHLDLGAEDSRRAPLETLLENLVKQGFRRLLPPPDWIAVREIPAQAPGSLDELLASKVLVDRLVVREGAADRLTDSLETCFTEGNGVAEVLRLRDRDQAGAPQVLRFTERFECQYCHIAYRSPEPRLFSFNNPYGACPTCHGFGNTVTIDPELVIPDPHRTIAEGPIEPFGRSRYRKYQQRLEQFVQSRGHSLDTRYCDLPEQMQREIWHGVRGFSGVQGFFDFLETKKYKMHVRILISRFRGYARCPDCGGERLCVEARDVQLAGLRISQLTARSIGELGAFFRELELSASRQAIAAKLLEEIRHRLDFLSQVGLDYLSLDRLTSTLSGGEMQRIHLAASLGSSLVGTLYVLDEPSIGLHPRDERRLIRILGKLRDLGNTVVVVEHERQMIENADHVIDLGPRAGEQGGRVMHSGDLASLRGNPDSLTGRYLTGELKVPIPVFRRNGHQRKLVVHGARQHNLKNLTAEIPLGLLVCITGVSGSGKSTLVHDVLYAGLKQHWGEWKGAVGEFDEITGEASVDEVLLVDQNPIGKTPRSNPVTYVKAFDEIRRIFSSLRQAEARNLRPGHFSFNIGGGRCETCQGAGTVTVEMQFLADVELTCEDCGGARYQNKVLEVRYKGRNIADVLQMTVDEAVGFFKGSTALVKKLKVLQEVGLGYVRLGQSATTLSGGEAQRIKLCSYLSRSTSRHPLFIFDEPTTGLHFDDIQKLLRAFDRLLAKGATVVVIEHNLDVIKCADWIIDLGPEGGQDGGRIIAQGTPEQVAEVESSYTGRYLRELFEGAGTASER